MKHFWFDLPSDLTKIDAVYERPHDKKIVFFIGNWIAIITGQACSLIPTVIDQNPITGRKYWVFSGNNPDPGYPKPLTHLGLAKHIERIDAAMVWGHNGKTYLFSGNKYWRLEETDGKVELDYPRDMDIWQGVPYDIDAAFQWHTNGGSSNWPAACTCNWPCSNTECGWFYFAGITYFFKGNKFYEFNNRKMSITADSPKIATHFWFDSQCRQVQERVSGTIDQVASSQPVTTITNSYLTCCTLTLLLLLQTSCL